MTHITGILLAAGASQRFGADKLTQHLADGECVAIRACQNLLAGVDEVIAVVRPGNPYLHRRLQEAGAHVAEFADADLGMGNSLAFAVDRAPQVTAWLVALADMPWIAPATIRRTADALREGALIAAPIWHTQRGHPVGFSNVLRDELLTLTGDKGAKDLIRKYSEQLTTIDSGDAGILRDIDRPEDLNPATRVKPLCF